MIDQPSFSDLPGVDAGTLAVPIGKIKRGDVIINRGREYRVLRVHRDALTLDGLTQFCTAKSNFPANVEIHRR